MNAVIVPTPFRPFTDDQKVVEIDGDTVGAVLENLTLRYPQLRQHLYDDDGRLHPFVNIFVRESEIRSLQGVDTPLTGGERVIIAAAISGGGEG
jgi:molybdopterin converting factor small subunit